MTKLPAPESSQPTKFFDISLPSLGWSPFFQTQLALEEMNTFVPARIMGVHRGAFDVAAPQLRERVSQRPAPPFLDEQIAVGDWVLLDLETKTIHRRLDRSSLFKRRAAGTDRKVQLIAANVNTVFIVSSCNADFNLARLERYLVLARDADVMPVVVLTKADTCEDPSSYGVQARDLMPGLLVEVINGRSVESASCLLPWCGVGQTVAVLGSSGVGKSTLVNTLSGNAGQDTQHIREDDAKGRHTTTSRSLHPLPSGGLLLDSPGMRELQLTNVEEGLEHVFSDILDLADRCKFSDCAHAGEPGCAVEEAIRSDALDPGRLKRFHKLVAEDARNSASLAERRAKDKSLGKMYRNTKKLKDLRRGSP